MKIIDNYSYISDFSVDPDFFRRFSSVKCRLRGSRFWKVSKNNSFTLVNDLAFFAFEKESKDVFLKYEGTMLLNVVFAEMEKDVEGVIEQINYHYSLMKDFISHNSLTFYGKIDKSMLEFESNHHYKMLKDEIEEVKLKKKYEDLSDDELLIQEIRPKISFKL